MFIVRLLTPLSTSSYKLVVNSFKNTSIVHQFTAYSKMVAPKYYERLPKNVVPTFYQLELTPNLESFTFIGKENIDVDVNENTNKIILNSAEIEIQDAQFTDGSGCSFKGQVSLDAKDEKAIIQFDKLLQTGKGVLSLEFSGILNDRMKGFYRTKYVTPSGEERYAATTQFEAPDARRAFPCWDEPSFKAKFQVKIIAPKDRTVLSNTEPIEQSTHPENANLQIVKFAPTPIMSTYLLAFIVGEYEFLETISQRGTKIRVYSPIGKKEQGSVSLEFASKSLSIFEDFFQIPFPLSKLDHIAIPDFASGAMENWGLITYRETRILYDPKNTSAINLEIIAIVVAHETAHQWFGNLVTMDWWTDLWLNEGFASFMEYYAVDKMRPEFDILTKFLSWALIPALKLDALRNSHPIEVEVHHTDDIDSIFDLISYEKGASIIRMCHDWLGDEAFRNGLHAYLKKYSYGNAVTQNLWDSLEAASGKPVTKMMPYWTKQKGFPVVEISSKQDGNNLILTLKQRLFTPDGILSEEEDKVFWMVPISVVTSQDPNKIAISTLMDKKSTELVIPDTSAGSWVKVNYKMNGFYRCNYSAEMLENLKLAILNKQLPVIDRLQIIDDLFALVISGQTRCDHFLKMLEAYEEEEDLVVWNIIDSCVSQLSGLIDYTDFADKFNQFCLNFYSKIYNKLGLNIKNEKAFTENQLRTLVLYRLVKLNYAPVIEESEKLFKNHLAGNPIHPDHRRFVYTAVASKCDDETFNSFFKLYRDSDSAEEKVRLIQSLAAGVKSTRTRKVLDFALSSEVRSQDAWLFLRSAATSKDNCEEAWKFFKEHSAIFWERHGAHQANARLIEGLIVGFASVEKSKDVETFFAQNPFSGHENVILRGLEIIEANARWLERDANNTKKFLESKLKL